MTSALNTGLNSAYHSQSSGRLQHTSELPTTVTQKLRDPNAIRKPVTGIPFKDDQDELRLSMLRMQSKEDSKNRATSLAPHPLKAPSFQGNNGSTINLVELAEKNGITIPAALHDELMSLRP